MSDMLLRTLCHQVAGAGLSAPASPTCNACMKVWFKHRSRLQCHLGRYSLCLKSLVLQAPTCRDKRQGGCLASAL